MGTRTVTVIAKNSGEELTIDLGMISKLCDWYIVYAPLEVRNMTDMRTAVHMTDDIRKLVDAENKFTTDHIRKKEADFMADEILENTEGV